MSAQAGHIYRRSDYGGFLRRTIALAIDLALWFAVFVVTAITWSLATGALGDDEAPYDWAFLVTDVGFLAYHFALRTTRRGTLGYRIMRIEYAPMLEGPISRLNLFYRAVVAIFLMWFFALDHLWILFDEHKQAWHDKLAGFYVIRRGAKPIATCVVRRRVINFMMLTFVVWEPDGDGAESSVHVRASNE